MTLHCLQIKVGTSQFGIQSLVWYSVWSCVTSSSYPHSQCSPLGTLCPCYLEHPTVLTLLWINLFLLIPWSPFLYWANSYVTFKVLINVISYRKPSLILCQQHLLLPSLDLYGTLHTPQYMQFYQLFMCHSFFRLETLVSHLCVS